jgi:riboflavin synthase
VFTGIVEATGVVREVHPAARSARIVVESGRMPEGTRVGQSIAVNGACLTIARIGGSSFEADLSPETLARTTLGRLRPGDAVNLEMPLALGDRLGGHLVSGHVDGVGRVARRWPEGDAWWLDLLAPPALARYIVEKGSITVDGVSLTVAGRREDGFTVCLVPHTSAVTTLGRVEPGAEVNLEVDMLAKYVEQLMDLSQGGSTDE